MRRRAMRRYGFTTALVGGAVILGFGCFDPADAAGTQEAQTTPAASQAKPHREETQSPVKPGRELGKVTTSGPVQQGPLLVDPLSIDFGLVAPRSKVSKTVKLTNTSENEVRITQVAPTCQCTSVLDDLVNKVIAPGESVPMELAMETPASPLIKQAGVLLTVTGHNKPIKVDITCEVTLPIRAVPPFIDIQQTPLSTQDASKFQPRPLTGEIVLESIDHKPFKLMSSLTKAIWADRYDPSTDPPRSSYTLKYDFRNVPCSDIPKYAVLETDREDCPALDLRVRHECAVISPGFSVEAFVAGVGQVSPGGSGEFEMVVKKKMLPVKGDPKQRQMVPSKISGVTSMSKDFTVALIDVREDKEHFNTRIRVTPREGLTGLFSGPVVFSDGALTAEVIVYGVVR